MIETYMTIVSKLGEYYSKNLTPDQIDMYAEDLSVLTPEQLIQAIKTYRNDPANKFFPLPSQLISVIRPVETETDIGRVVAARIMTALGKFGVYSPGPENAKEWLGDLAWQVVIAQGGWRNIKELTTEAVKAEQPRWRDLAISISKRAKLGTLDQAPALPEKSSDAANLIQTTMKLIGGEK